MRSKSGRAEQIVIKQIRDGEEKALNLVYPPLRKFISSTLAKHSLYCQANTKDVCQQTFLEFYGKKNNFPENDLALLILCGFAKNLINQLINKTKKVEYKDNEDELSNCCDQQNHKPEGEWHSDTLIPSIKRIINQLPKKKARALDYFLFSGVSEEEISKKLKYKNVKVLRVVISEAKKMFIEEIKKEENHQHLDDCLKWIKTRL